MKKNTPSLNSLDVKKNALALLKPVTNHLTFMVIVASIGVLIYSVMVVSTILSNQNDEEYRTSRAKDRIIGSFESEAETIKKINNLNTSSENSSIQLPAGRVSPFNN